MANKEFPYIYPYSFAEAKRLGELNDWKASHKENIACKDAIEAAIRRDFDGMHLKTDCAASVIADFGYHRVSYVLANSLQCKDYDGRFSRGNKEWAQQTYIPPDKDSYSNRNLDFAVDSHPAVLDGFVNQYRRAYQGLGMFDHTHCLPDTEKQDFEGKVVVLSPRNLKEKCLTAQDQLWLCTGGFGSHADARGRAVYATNLSDGEKTRWNRSDFIGVLADSHLPDWARESLTELQGQEQTAGDSSEMGGMTMQ
ncbi:DUF3849 domain-containing protein [Lacrimispora defluvii]|uniref:DUF3849 domain-containing protein n=1 Tax=Lacrimispora defluvii TaxID=2719233 RepID=A0ABX1VKT3_9FIRM|nr:DUF3849 domain-containing protein [Lacrimispora defluvii]NNJ28569.1 DUF3849 domain-containing protein [Lacrimispora defluvii]